MLIKACINLERVFVHVNKNTGCTSGLGGKVIGLRTVLSVDENTGYTSVFGGKVIRLKSVVRFDKNTS